MDSKENQKLNLIIANLISSDNNTSRKEIIDNIARLKKLMKDDNVKENNFFKTKCKQGIRILERDLKDYPEEEDEDNNYED